DACLALLAAGNTVLAAAMRQWQREEGELPQTNAANAAISAKRFGV
ncbi:MAG: hypothetical protein JNJ78_15690, partial [Anaerolineae bacterium]|nr:hypothetical protein [Anaerolineae bacterium]